MDKKIENFVIVLKENDENDINEAIESLNNEKNML